MSDSDFDALPLAKELIESHYRRGDQHLIQAIKDQGVNPEDIMIDNMTLLGFALDKGYTSAVKELVEVGVDLNKPVMEDGLTPVAIALGTGQLEAAKVLIDGGADLYFQSEKNMGGVNFLFHRDNTFLADKVIDQIIDQGVNIDKRLDTLGNTLLHLAIAANNDHIAHKLVTLGSDISVRNVYGETPVDLALFTKQEAVIKSIIEKGGRLPFEEVIKCNLGSIYQWVDKQLENEKSAQNLFEKVLFHKDNVNTDVYQYVFDKVSDPNIVNDKGESLLVYAINKQESDLVSDLIEKGVHVKQEINGETMLERAVLAHMQKYNANIKELKSIVKTLLIHSVEINHECTHKKSAAELCDIAGLSEIKSMISRYKENVIDREQQGIKINKASYLILSPQNAHMLDLAVAFDSSCCANYAEKYKHSDQPLKMIEKFKAIRLELQDNKLLVNRENIKTINHVKETLQLYHLKCQSKVYLHEVNIIDGIVKDMNSLEKEPHVCRVMEDKERESRVMSPSMERLSKSVQGLDNFKDKKESLQQSGRGRD